MSLRVVAALAAGLTLAPPLALAAPDPCVVGFPLSVSCGAVPPEGCCADAHVVWCAPDGATLCALPCTGDGGCGYSFAKEIYDCSTPGLPDPTGALPKECDWTCTPDCDGKQCGSDGCLGTCGACPPEAPICDGGGQCVSCLPDCAGKACGLNGCGGLCGVCSGGQTCGPDGQCCAADCEGAECGSDGCGGSCGACGWPTHCTEQRTCESCSCDGRVCGDDGCGEGCGTCPAGQGCAPAGQCAPIPAGCKVGGAGCVACACTGCVCESDPWCCGVAWDSVCAGACAKCGACGDLCVPDCQGRVCGDTDGCGGSCGDCPAGMRCAGFGKKCLPCTCAKKECGEDGCGMSCGTCSAGEVCAKGTCVPQGCGPTSAPGCAGCVCEACVCDNDPTCCTVAWDWTCATACRYECHGCPCIPDCDGRECGWVGCGYTKFTCGTCPTGDVCTLDGLCCKPSCTGKECGSDGCGGLCGSCPTGEVCHEGQCTCVPVCEGKACGPDGCGGSCGGCPVGTSCRGAACHPDYPAACLGAGLPSADACPPGLGFAGCCDDGGRVVWCDGGALYCLSCLPGDGCGWRTQKPNGQAASWYDCGGAGPDPSGAATQACGALCIPSCSGKECGPDGCGGTCGPECGAGVPCVGGVCSPPVVDAGATDAGAADGVNQPDVDGADDAAALDGTGEDGGDSEAPPDDGGSANPVDGEVEDAGDASDGVARPDDGGSAARVDAAVDAEADADGNLDGGAGGDDAEGDGAGARHPDVGPRPLDAHPVEAGGAGATDGSSPVPDVGGTCGPDGLRCDSWAQGPSGAAPVGTQGGGCAGCDASGASPWRSAMFAFLLLLTLAWMRRVR